MAELPSSDIKMKSTAGPAVGLGAVNFDIELRQDLCNYNLINQYAFFRPQPIRVHSTTKIPELDTPAPSSNRKLGDFRRYDKDASTPVAASDYTQNYGPGGNIDITLTTYIYSLNLKELEPSTTLYWVVDIYLTSGNRSAQINRHHRATQAVSFTSETPPSGHTNNQTQKPVGDFQNITVTGISTVGLTQPDDVLYCDTYISNSGVTSELVRFSDSYTDVDVHEYAHPYIDSHGPNLTPVCKVNDGGGDVTFTFMAIAVTDSSSNSSGVDFQETNGSTNYGGSGFYWFIYGLAGSNYYRIGNRDVTVEIQGDVTSTEIFNGTLNNAGASSNETDSGTLSGGDSWSYDDVADLVATSVDWTTSTVLTPGSNEVYDMGTTAP